MDKSETSLNVKTSINILDNAFDFLIPSTKIIEKFGSNRLSLPEKDELKIALISISNSIELILKCKIAYIDWKQLFQNPNKADKKNY